LNKIDKEKLVKNYKKILIALSPVIPHFSSECMEMISIKENLKWPEVEEKFLFNDNVKFIIQFNGKTRKIIVSEKNTTESLLLTKIKEDSKLSEYLNNKNIQKKIFIPNKLINIITS
jgi:leucyl-tRNA synthetase